MGLAFVILFPVGGLIIRFLASILPVPVKLHYSVQIFSFTIVLAAAGVGIYLSRGFQFTTFRTTPISPDPPSFPDIFPLFLSFM